MQDHIEVTFPNGNLYVRFTGRDSLYVKSGESTVNTLEVGKFRYTVTAHCYRDTRGEWKVRRGEWVNGEWQDKTHYVSKRDSYLHSDTVAPTILEKILTQVECAATLAAQRHPVLPYKVALENAERQVSAASGKVAAAKQAVKDAEAEYNTAANNQTQVYLDLVDAMREYAK